MPDRLIVRATQVAELLQEKQQRLVLAESCTGGLVAATLVQVPGISQWFCGSVVVYREPTKTEWLEIPASVLQQFSAESQETTACLAEAALGKTSEATLAAAVTGHLGPNAPANDGQIFVAVHHRSAPPMGRQISLQSATRSNRQREAASEVFALLIECMQCG
ncbi:MAG: CinA family protein [Pirellulaceae bacterium]|nr:CinA family protein [Planctomycetaceae bacterium]HIM29977.1 CinA family protein [Planctomycetota bacterium]